MRSGSLWVREARLWPRAPRPLHLRRAPTLVCAALSCTAAVPCSRVVNEDPNEDVGSLCSLCLHVTDIGRSLGEPARLGREALACR